MKIEDASRSMRLRTEYEKHFVLRCRSAIDKLSRGDVPLRCRFFVVERASLAATESTGPGCSTWSTGHCLLVFRSRGARRARRARGARRAREAREAREARRARGARPWGPWGPWSPSSPWGPWGQGRVNECLLFSGLLLRTPLCDCRCPNLPVISIILHMINDCF